MNTLMTIVTICFVALIALAPPCWPDELSTLKINKLIESVDKNGQPYTRVLTTQKHSLNGISYESEDLIMAFGKASTDLKGVKPGDTVKAVTRTTTKDGRQFTNIVALIK